jgi:broad specificity phosphatase PhoE
MSEGRRKRQVSLKAAYGALYTEVSRLMREADPIRLIAIGAPEDEYDVELRTILPRLREAKSSDDVQRIVHEEFVHWFSAEIAGPAEQYAEVSKNIWEVWNKFPVSS